MKKLLLILILYAFCSCDNDHDKSASPFVETNILTKKQSDLIFEKSQGLPNQTQIAIAIIKNGEAKFYGVQRNDDSSLAINNQNSVFEIGAITKVFTGTLLSNFIIDHKINLDNNINDFLNFPLKDSILLTFEQLATHSAGLPRIPASLDSVRLDNPYKGYGKAELKRYLSQELELQQEPGKKSTYSNISLGLLAYVLEEMEQTSYEMLLQENIFSKYKMENTTTIRNKVEEQLVKGLNDQGEDVPNWDLSAFVGAGGILSSIDDMTKFALAQFDHTNKELELTRRSFFTVTENYSMGLGWGLVKQESGAIWNYHKGGTGGYTSSFIIDSDTKNGVIILSNISALGELTNNITSLCPELMETL